MRVCFKRHSKISRSHKTKKSNKSSPLKELGTRFHLKNDWNNAWVSDSSQFIFELLIYWPIISAILLILWYSFHTVVKSSSDKATVSLPLDCCAEISSILWKIGNVVKIHNTINDTSILTYGHYILKPFLFLRVISHPLNDIFYGRLYWHCGISCFVLTRFLFAAFCISSHWPEMEQLWPKDSKSESIPFFKSVVAQQEYCNVSCLQQWIEQFSFTHVPDSLLYCTCASRFL